MALSEEAKRIARELGMREELPQVSDKPLTPEERERILDKMFSRHTPMNFGLDDVFLMDDLPEEGDLELKESLRKAREREKGKANGNS